MGQEGLDMKKGFSLEEEDIAKLKACSQKGLCDACLGRCVAKRGRGLSNSERGAMVRAAFDDGTEAVEAGDCWLCEGLVDEYDKFTGLVDKALGPYDFDTFLLGSILDKGVKEREKELQEVMDEKDFEPFKSEINREVGKVVAVQMGKDVDFDRSDIVALLDTRFDIVRLEVHSIFLYGRYRKFERGIPQTKWPCKICRGKGCERCNGTGRMYETSVEEHVAGPIVEYLEAKGQSFHGMGREDIDARMLGNGRPFVLEVKGPRLRRTGPEDLSRLEALINERAKGSVEVEGLRPSNKEEVRAIKDRRCFKSYEVEIEVGEEVERDRLEAVIEDLRGRTIEQRTPTRVAHRRGDLVRKRQVRSMDCLDMDNRIVKLGIMGEAGIYIKELVTGDEGRTEPSLAGLLGVQCKVQALDVVQIHDEMEG